MLIKELILENNDVNYFRREAWIDAGNRRPEVKKFDLLMISPENYYNFTHPWHPNLDPYLEEVWSYEQTGQKIAKLYKIKIEGNKNATNAWIQNNFSYW